MGKAPVPWKAILGCAISFSSFIVWKYIYVQNGGQIYFIRDPWLPQDRTLGTFIAQDKANTKANKANVDTKCQKSGTKLLEPWSTDLRVRNGEGNDTGEINIAEERKC